MHSSIQKVPALVLDCEPNIDFSRDIEAKPVAIEFGTNGNGNMKRSYKLEIQNLIQFGR